MSFRSVFVVAVTVVLAAACSGSTRPAQQAAGDRPADGPAAATTAVRSGTSGRSPSFAVDQTAPSPRENVAAALQIPAFPDDPTTIRFDDPAFGPPLVHWGDLKPGGPPPDGIPALDHPRFELVADVDFLRDNEPVLALELAGEARAYPVQILVWHEIVNDTLAGVPVAVTYCPLCNSAVAYDRRLDSRVLDFGVSGALWNSALVMYDRQTRSLWSHFTGQGILGVLASAQLTVFPVALASWAQFKAAHPDGNVLSRDTGFAKDYGRNPYPGYDDVNNPPFLYDGKVDGRYAAKTRVVGIETPHGPIAVAAQRLQQDRIISATHGGDHLLTWWLPGAASALDTNTVADGRDVGITGAFDPTIDGQPMRFETADGGFRDQATSSTWNVFGAAIAGPLTGRHLTPLRHVDTFWFAWAAFWPDTDIID